MTCTTQHKNCPGCGALIAPIYSFCLACRMMRAQARRVMDVLGFGAR